jgi:hypothetical protein
MVVDSGVLVLAFDPAGGIVGALIGGAAAAVVLIVERATRRLWHWLGQIGRNKESRAEKQVPPEGPA